MSLCSLYFIADEARTAIKIGITRRDPGKRLYDLQAGSPVRLVLEHVEHDIQPSCEFDLHQHFSRHWRHREWFTYADEIRDFVAALIAGDRWVFDHIPPAPYPKGYRTEFGWLLTREDTLRYLRDGVSVAPL